MSRTILEPWVTAPELAQHLSKSVSWVHKAVAEGTIPVHRAGRGLRFKLSEIDAWMHESVDA